MLDGTKRTMILERTLRQLVPAVTASEAAVFPKQLTARAHRLLEQGRDLLGRLRALADHFEPAHRSEATAETSSTRTPQGGADPLGQRYQETVAMANAALRMIQAFPDAASAQLPLCAGLEAILNIVAERIAALRTVLEERQRSDAEVKMLANLLRALAAKQNVDRAAFTPLAEAIVAEAQQGAPLRFLTAPPEQPAEFVASHSLTVAQVVARLVRQDPEYRAAPLEPVLAALVHDVGMLSVPPAILAQATPLDDEQRRLLEAHTVQGAELLAHLQPASERLAGVAASHHERLDGTGYPAGRSGEEITPLTRLVAVCDLYAALCVDRPHRPARDPRTALTDTLLLAEQGALDRNEAERLLALSFYPVGSVVELADGALGVVVATHMGRRDLTTPARPVLALLTDAQGQRLPVPRHLDLAECDKRSIVRTIPRTACATLLGSQYPELA